MNVGYTLKRLIKSKGLTESEVAKMVGISTEELILIESGIGKYTTDEKVERILAALGYPVYALESELNKTESLMRLDHIYLLAQHRLNDKDRIELADIALDYIKKHNILPDK